GADYTALSGTITFSPGQTTQSVSVKVLGDLLVEANETFFLKLSNVANATLGRDTVQATILDNDQSIIRTTDITVTEGNSGTSDAILPITLSAPNSQTVTVQFATQDDTAKAGSDYIVATGAITFAPGEITKNLVLKIIGDTVVENAERFIVKFSNPANATL